MKRTTKKTLQERIPKPQALSPPPASTPEPASAWKDPASPKKAPLHDEEQEPSTETADRAAMQGITAFSNLDSKSVPKRLRACPERSRTDQSPYLKSANEAPASTCVAAEPQFPGRAERG